MSELQTLIRKVDKLLSAQEVNDLLTEDEAAKLLDVTTRTIKNYVYDMRIPASAYTIGPTGARFYKKSKLTGLK